MCVLMCVCDHRSVGKKQEKEQKKKLQGSIHLGYREVWVTVKEEGEAWKQGAELSKDGFPA